MNSRFLLIGANGWVGQHTVRELNRHGIPWIGADRRLTSQMTAGQLRTVEGSETVSRDISVVVNFAGREVQGNELGHYLTLTRHLSEMAKLNGYHYVHIGSAAEYGNPSKDFADELDTANPVTEYGRFKLKASRIAESNGALVLRPFNLVGRGQPSHTVVGDWMMQILENSLTAPTVRLRNPALVRDFVSVEFLAQTIVKLGSARASGFVNVCSGVGTSYGKFLDELIEASGKVCKIEVGREPGIPRVVGSPRRLSALGISTTDTTRELVNQLFG